METSERTEGALVAAGAILDSIATFIAASPIPFEWKAPVALLTASVGTALLGFWYSRVNKPVG